MSDCIFCKIIAGELPCRKIYEDDLTFAFLDIFPASKGHTLVIPKVHCSDIHDVDAQLYGKVATTSKLVADLLQEKLGAEGTTIFQMNREAGWQTVFHLHMHVIPRWNEDALHKPWDIAPASEDDLADVHRLVSE
jgi:histidine triad (HIT) family protein